MSRLNATKNYAKDKTIHLSKYLASFSIVFKVFEVFSGAKIRQIAVLEVASSFARRFTEILFDINKVLEYKNINKDDFYNKTLLSEELKTPITALYIIDNYENLDNMSQFEIYNNICLQLCNEYNGQLNKQILNANERIKVAATLFT